MKALRPVLFCGVLVVLALWLRLPGLDSFLTPDESVWASGTAQFVSALRTGDWAATNISGHPGITTIWAGSAGLLARWLCARPQGIHSLTELAQDLAAHPVRLDYLPWLRAPVALACALGIAAIYLLARRLLSEPLALLAAVLISLDPFYLAHGRVLQMDALLTTTICISWLALLVAMRTEQRRYYLRSGLAIGLAVLS